MNNWFRFEIQIRPPAYSRMEALAQQKACQGKDVCSSNTTGSPNTTPVESDSTTPCQHSSQAPVRLGRLRSLSIIKDKCFLKNWDPEASPLTELDAEQTFIFVLAHSVRISLCKPMGAASIKRCRRKPCSSYTFFPLIVKDRTIRRPAKNSVSKNINKTSKRNSHGNVLIHQTQIRFEGNAVFFYINIIVNVVAMPCQKMLTLNVTAKYLLAIYLLVYRF